MSEPLFDQILECRRGNGLRLSLQICKSDDLDKILKNFGLNAKKENLVQVEIREATEILSYLLWKDLAYSVELCPKEKAKETAMEILTQYANEESKIYSNGLWHKKEKEKAFAYSTFTDATFDAGIIIKNNVEQICIWFEGED